MPHESLMLLTTPVSAPVPLANRTTGHRDSQQPLTSTAAAREDILRLIAECDATLEREPQCLHTRAVRGHACMKAKLWDRAIADFGLILSSRPDDVHGRFSRGMALFKSGRVEDAHADFSRVLELNPHHVMARYARAGCYNTEGKFHHAIQDYTIALQHDEKDQDAVVGGRQGLRGWHQEAEKLVNEKLSGSDVVRKSRRGGGGTNPEGDELTRRRATMVEGVGRPKSEGEEPRRASMTVATPSTSMPSETNAKTIAKKPRKVVQVKLDLGGAVAATEATKAPAPAPVAAHVEHFEERFSPRCVSPRSNSRLRLERVPVSPTSTNQQPVESEKVTRRATQRREPLPWMEGSKAASQPRSPAPRIQAKPELKAAEMTQPMSPPSQPTKRAVRRVTVAL